jgi:hypothetical protein
LFWWANGIRIFSLCCFCEKLIYWGGVQQKITELERQNQMMSALLSTNGTTITAGRSKNREIGIETTMQLKMNLGLGCAAIAMTIVTILVNK